MNKRMYRDDIPLQLDEKAQTRLIKRLEVACGRLYEEVGKKASLYDDIAYDPSSKYGEFRTVRNLIHEYGKMAELLNRVDETLADGLDFFSMLRNITTKKEGG